VGPLRLWIARLRALFAAGSDDDAQSREELDAHVAFATAENVRRGMSPDEARRRALVDSGGLTAAAESVRDQRRLPWAEALAADLRYAVRTLRRSPAFTVVATLTLALGIGANTAIFSVVNGVILRPLPYGDADGLVSIASMRRGQAMAVSVLDFTDWRAGAHRFSGLAAGTTSSTTLTGTGAPQRLSQARVSANAFRVLEIRPILGRAFLDGEDEPTAPRVAMLGEGVWRRRFGADSSVVGKTLVFDGFPTTIVGIAPAAMRWPDAVDVWMTTRFTERDLSPSSRGSRWLDVVGRVAPASSVAAARGELEEVARRLERLDPNHNTAVTVSVTPLLESIVGDVRTPLLVLLGAVAFVLLIACANVASLTLARIAARDSELAVRTALGAARGRIARQILTESVVLALLGGALGLALAFGGIRGLIALAPPDLPRLREVTLDGRVLGFTFALTVLTGVVFGVVPALHNGTANLHDRLRSAARGALGKRGAARSRRTMVVAEVALAIVLLTGAGLLIRSFALLRQVDPGFRPENVTTFSIQLPPSGRYASPDQIREFTTSLLDGIRRAPGVSSVATTFALPMSGNSFGFTFTVAEHPPAPADNEPRAQARVVSPEYFAAMGIPVLRGRLFDENDRLGTPRKLIISAEVARRYFPNEDPIGKHIDTGWGMYGTRFGGEVIAVVGDVRQFSLDRERAPHLYMSYAQRPLNEYEVVVRSTATPSAVYAASRSVLTQLDPQIPLDDALPLTKLVDDTLGQRRFYLMLLALFAGVSMTLAVVGIYGVIAYGVQQRRREIGIRLALGASRERVVGMVVSEGLRLVAAGVVLGVAGAFALTRLLTALLFQVGARDPLAMTVAPLVLVLTAAAACLLPARAASRQNPAAAMHAV
jgi:predicted permease